MRDATSESRQPLPPRRPQLAERIVARRRNPLFRQLALLLGVDIPGSVVVGDDFRLYHRGRGVVIHPLVTFGDRCRVFHNVTVGRSDPYVPDVAGSRAGVHFEDDVWLCAGAVVLGGREMLTVGRGTIVAANAVLTCSTGEWEIWGGVPARKIGQR